MNNSYADMTPMQYRRMREKYKQSLHTLYKPTWKTSSKRKTCLLLGSSEIIWPSRDIGESVMLQYLVENQIINTVVALSLLVMNCVVTVLIKLFIHMDNEFY